MAPRFESHIAPLLKARCVKCHNSETRKADLDLSSPQGVFRGGESGDSVVPGKLDESLLWDMVHEKLMPPDDEPPLSATEINTFRRWIAAGAPFVEKVDLAELASAGEVNNHQIEPLMLLRCAHLPWPAHPGSGARPPHQRIDAEGRQIGPGDCLGQAAGEFIAEARSCRRNAAPSRTTREGRGAADGVERNRIARPLDRTRRSRSAARAERGGRRPRSAGQR